MAEVLKSSLTPNFTSFPTLVDIKSTMMYSPITRLVIALTLFLSIAHALSGTPRVALPLVERADRGTDPQPPDGSKSPHG